jgi:hypothetical protein
MNGPNQLYTGPERLAMDEQLNFLGQFIKYLRYWKYHLSFVDGKIFASIA